MAETAVGVTEKKRQTDQARISFKHFHFVTSLSLRCVLAQDERRHLSKTMDTISYGIPYSTHMHMKIDALKRNGI